MEWLGSLLVPTLVNAFLVRVLEKTMTKRARECPAEFTPVCY